MSSVARKDVQVHVACRWPHRLASLALALLLIESIGVLRLPIGRAAHLWVTDHTALWWCVAGPLAYVFVRLPPLWRPRTLRRWKQFTLLGIVPLPRSLISSAFIVQRGRHALLVITTSVPPFAAATTLRAATEAELQEVAMDLDRSLINGGSVTFRGAARLSTTVWWTTCSIAVGLILLGVGAGADLFGLRHQLWIYIFTAIFVAPILLLPRRRRISIGVDGVTVGAWAAPRMIPIVDIKTVTCTSALTLELANGDTVELAAVRPCWHPLHDDREQLLLRALKQNIENTVATSGRRAA